MWLLIAAALLSLVVTPLYEFTYASAPFAFFMLLLALGVVLKGHLGTLGLVSRCAFGFLLLCVAHLGFVLTGGVDLKDYLRALVPFVFLAFAAFGSASGNTQRNWRRVYTGIIIAAGAFAFEQLSTLPKMLSGEIWRSTQATTYFSVPFPLVGFHLSIGKALTYAGHNRLRAAAWGAAAIAMFAAELLTGTRSLILGCLLPLLVLPFAFRRGRVIIAGGLLVACVAIGSIDMVAKALRLESARGVMLGGTEGSVSARFDENSSALAAFAASPAVGVGLGHQFEDPSNLSDKRGYVHNSSLYLLMDFGIFGILYWLPAVIGFFMCWRMRKCAARYEVLAVAMAIAGVVIFAHGFAAVRGIHATVLLFTLVGCCEAATRVWRARPRLNTTMYLHSPIA